MLRQTIQDKYPNLVAYLQRTHFVNPNWFGTLRKVFLVLAFLPILPLIFAGRITLIESLAWAGLMFGIERAIWFGTRHKQPKAGQRDMTQAYDSIKVLREMFNFNRLHRDMSEATLVLLEEITRKRTEIKTLLYLPAWRDPNLGDSYRQVRAQALDAVDEATLEAFSQFRASLPLKVRPRRGKDYLSEVVENLPLTGLSIGRPAATRFAEPGFDSAYQIAERIQSLYNQLTNMTDRLSQEPGRANMSPGAKLEDTLREIKLIDQAEQELHLEH